MGYARHHPLAAAKTWAQVFPSSDLVEENIVLVYRVCWSLLYQSCWLLVLNQRDRVGCNTVLIPFCVVLLNVCWAWGIEMPHLLARASNEICCWLDVVKFANALVGCLARSAVERLKSDGRQVFVANLSRQISQRFCCCFQCSTWSASWICPLESVSEDSCCSKVLEEGIHLGVSRVSV